MRGILKKLAMVYLLIGFSFVVFAQGSFDELTKKGNAELVKQDYKKALEYFELAIKVGNENKSDLAWTATIAATCAQELKDNAKALKLYQVAIKNGTTDYSVFDAVFEIADKLKDKKGQEEVLLIGRSRIEDQYQRYTSKLLYFYFNNQMFAKVPAIANEVLQYKPEHLKTNYLLGVAYLNIGKEEEAIQTFELILSKDSLDENTNRQLGFLFYNKGQIIYNNANDSYNALQKPTRVDYSNYRKTVASSFDSFRKASVYLERAYSVKPDEQLKVSLFTLYTRLVENDKAAKFK